MTYTATLSELTRLRLLTGENTDASDYSDASLSEAIAEQDGDIYAAAASVWRWKAAALASSPTQFSADGGSYNFQDAYQRCLDEAERCDAMSAKFGNRMLIDPTLKPVEED